MSADRVLDLLDAIETGWRCEHAELADSLRDVLELDRSYEYADGFGYRVVSPEARVLRSAVVEALDTLDAVADARVQVLGVADDPWGWDASFVPPVPAGVRSWIVGE